MSSLVVSSGRPASLAAAVFARSVLSVTGKTVIPFVQNRLYGRKSTESGGYRPRRLFTSTTEPIRRDMINPARGIHSEATKQRPIYMDYQSTTPMDRRVLTKMEPYFCEQFGNAHSRTHSYGWTAEGAVNTARQEIADLIGCQAKEIVFTSGATECNNMCIKGVVEFYGPQNPQKRHIITTQVEHKCVLASCRYLQNQGWDVTYLPVRSDGLVDIKEFEAAIRPGETLLASVIFVHNEIGVIQPIKAISEICRKHKIVFHTDGAQAVGKIPIDVNDLGIDLMSMSAHKMYGPKGIGATYIRSRPRVRLAPIIHGGGQERGFRSGTLPVPLIVGFGEAARICSVEMEADREHVTRLARRLYEGIKKRIPDVILNGSWEERYYGNLNLSFAFVEGESLIMSIPNLAVSSGSACTSASLEPSYVLRALGVDEELAHTSLRFGIGRFTTEAEVDEVVEAIVKNITKLREMSPLYEMAQEGGANKMVWT